MTIRFPEEMRRKFAKDNISPGNILYLRFKFPQQNKSEDKYFLVVGEDNNPLLLKVNSKLSQFVKGNANRQNCQFEIKTDDYKSYIKKGSYLDCSYVWYSLTRAEIEEQLFVDRDRVMGEIKRKHIKKIVELVEKSKTIAGRHKKIISNSFER